MARATIAAALLVGASACSFLVSTSGLDEGDAIADSGSLDDLSAPASDGAIGDHDGPEARDGATDASIDDARAIDADASDALATGDTQVVDAAAPDALVGLWSFDEPGGTVAHDGTGAGHDGTLLSGVTFADGGVEGGAVTFDGTGVLDIPSWNNAAFPSTGTLALWLRPEVDAGGGVAVFDSYDSNRHHMFMRQVSGAKIQTALQPAAQAYAFVVEIPTPITEWTHVAITWDLTTKTAATYANGALLSGGPYLSDFTPSEQHLRFGGSGFYGTIDEIRLFDRALSAGEVAAIP
jgi:hypothetical protein